MYKIPLEIPKYCNNCPFGSGRYYHTSWCKGTFIDEIDGKSNEIDTYGYVCNLDYKANNRYTKVMRAKVGENVKKPSWCGLVEADYV